TDEFKKLAHDLALQIAASDPKFVSASEIPDGAKLNAEEVCLLEQPFIRDQNRKVRDLVNEVIAKVGENVSVRRFARFDLGG
ncbi:MAG: elongation factor Ts, partial [Chloroflexi bacterium]|nr:elongation factor Ts [Chloroflexota bacterium]